ncbi:MAG: hypothetical protein ACRDKD_10290 [Solirubrobacteraceae bacterium]
MPAPNPRPLPPIRYRIVCYEIHDGEQQVILDDTAHAFIAVTGTIDENNMMRGNGTNAGPDSLLRRLASVIADDDQLAG